MNIFNNTDYESNNGMQTAIFGPPLWHTLHTMSFNYPMNPTESDKKNYTVFILSLEHVLPCSHCRDNYKNNLTESKFNPGVMKNRNTFSRFIYDLHNHVNHMLGKTIKISYEDVRDRYEHFRARCSKITDVLPKNAKEKSCSGSLHSIKSKCLLHIIPADRKDSFKMDKRCKSKKVTLKKPNKKKKLAVKLSKTKTTKVR
jgi:hypothetical protein